MTNSNGVSAFTARTHIAYLSMEIALRPEMHTYSGGLGILAGDTVRSTADLELPIVFVTLVCRQGYLRQEIDPQGKQINHPDPWHPEQWASPLGAKIVVEIGGREVWIRPWLHVQSSPRGYRVPIILLDTDLEENAPEDRRITDQLYGGDEEYRLKQEIVLGIGAVRVLHTLGFDIRTYHLNEGHAALLTVELLRMFRIASGNGHEGPTTYDIARVRDMCNFTTHTPVEAGHDRFEYALARRLLGDLFDVEMLKTFAGVGALNMTRLALSLCGYVNGVAQRHAETTTRMFPGYRVHAVVNGVHTRTWTSPYFAQLFDAHFPGWSHEPEILVRADQLPEDAVWDAHQKSKQDLIGKIRWLSSKQFDPEIPIIAFARRMTGYKRPELLFSEIERLLAIHRERPLQIVMAGKAHPKDGAGQAMIERLHGIIRDLDGKLPIVFLPGYDMALAKVIVGGADIWLNTPLPPLEASGTSGMKAALNGVLNLSVLDGWWVEACINGANGWAIGKDAPGGDGHADALYTLLEREVLPCYYSDRKRWNWMMRQAISKIAFYFNSQRMMRRYATEAYLR
ncbi:MAG: alpha-glucan family phosphorylase [Alphaproteobacteria bacterium]|nr:alpha-glucan family phosphorylase [Alphaproteobacteria bacterium]